MGRPKSKKTADRRAAARTMYERGLSQGHIAARLGVSQSAVSRYVRGIPAESRQQRACHSQLRQLRFILNTVRDRHYQPSIREMASEMGYTYQAAAYNVGALERLGYVVRDRGRDRALTITSKTIVEFGEELFYVPA